MPAGRETLLEEEYTQEHVEQELSPLSVQLAYAASQMGQHFQALQQYQVLNWGFPRHLMPRMLHDSGRAAAQEVAGVRAGGVEQLWA